MIKKLFLPGASGSARFWQPVAARLPAEWDCHLFSWPGLGTEPHRDDVRGIDDLVTCVIEHMSGPTDLIAQSMGGLIAMKAALLAPDRVRRLVLTGTSGGLPVHILGGADWRPAYRKEFPKAAPWIMEVHEDLSASLFVITAPTLLLWGDEDEISPPLVGQKLEEALPNALLRIVAGGQHDFPITHAQEVAELVCRHLV